jgi:hypothetical protein
VKFTIDFSFYKPLRIQMLIFTATSSTLCDNPTTVYQITFHHVSQSHIYIYSTILWISYIEFGGIYIYIYILDAEK